MSKAISLQSKGLLLLFHHKLTWRFLLPRDTVIYLKCDIFLKHWCCSRWSSIEDEIPPEEEEPKRKRKKQEEESQLETPPAGSKSTGKVARRKSATSILREVSQAVPQEKLTFRNLAAEEQEFALCLACKEVMRFGAHGRNTTPRLHKMHCFAMFSRPDNYSSSASYCSIQVTLVCWATVSE